MLDCSEDVDAPKASPGDGEPAGSCTRAQDHSVGTEKFDTNDDTVACQDARGAFADLKLNVVVDPEAGRKYVKCTCVDCARKEGLAEGWAFIGLEMLLAYE
jgi:hypothetical protein